MQTETFRDSIRRSKLYYRLGDPIYRLKGRLYDMRHGVMTAPEMQIVDHTVDGPNARLACKHAGTEPKYFRHIMSSVDWEFERLTFIDFGSGMGRALFLASEWPFDRIIGVEFSKELNDIAEKNIARFRSPRQACKRIETVWHDAATYKLPNEPSVFYFFNPFGPEIFAQVLANIEASLAANPREAYVLYTNPCHDRLFSKSPFFEPLNRGPWHTLHKARGSTQD
jgi:hypothetical protein